MNFQELCDAETKVRRALRSVRTFANEQDNLLLDKVEALLSEARQAAYFICDVGCPDSIKVEAVARLLSHAFGLPKGPSQADVVAFTLAEISDACIDAEISDGHAESLEIALLDRRKRYG